MGKHALMGLLSLIAGLIAYKYMHGLYYDDNPMMKELANSGFKLRHLRAVSIGTGVAAGVVAGIGWFPSFQVSFLRLWAPLSLVVAASNLEHVGNYLAAAGLSFAASAALSCVNWRRNTEDDW
ncbi:hypothetical protein [Gorillibacterium sp. sgz5001074]|uniref:hypothetical protein n=1 Tax=Gorillibacterium sp. sgz5001074 TaxID=3446695 RepID=UPI003F66F2C9